ncbi:MAG: hypothetical protein AB7S53_11400 [Thiomonas sp.]
MNNVLQPFVLSHRHGLLVDAALGRYPDRLPGSDSPDLSSDQLSRWQRGIFLLAGITPGRVGSPTGRSAVMGCDE